MTWALVLFGASVLWALFYQPRALLLAVPVAGLVLGLVALSDQAQSACASADRLLASSLVDNAATEYTKLLSADDPHPSQVECARDGLIRTADRRCDMADALAIVGQSEKAKEIYTAVIERGGEIEPAQCAVDGLTALPPPPPPPKDEAEVVCCCPTHKPPSKEGCAWLSD